MMNDTIDICYCTDKKYWFLFLISLQSLLKTKSINTKINLYLLVCDFSTTEINKLKSFFMQDIFVLNQTYITIIDIGNNKYKVRQKNSQFPDSVFIRLLIPQIITNVDKLIYIDCDTIIQKDLKTLFNWNIGNSIFGAIQDFGVTINKKHLENGCDEPIVKWIKNIPYIYEYNLPYVNSGILLYNLKKIRTIHFSNRCDLRYRQYSNRYIFPDQDLINFEFQSEIQILPIEFNNQFALLKNLKFQHLYGIDAFNWTFGTNYTTQEDLLDNSTILHYSMDKNMLYREREYSFFKEFFHSKVFETSVYFDIIQTIVEVNQYSFDSLLESLNRKSLLNIFRL